MTSKNTDTYSVGSTGVSKLYAEQADGGFVRLEASEIIHGSDVAAGVTWYASAANTLAKRSIGTAGHTISVAGGIPVWQRNDGIMTLIQRQTFTSVASVSFTTGFSTAYDSYLFVFSDVFPNTDNSQISFIPMVNGVQILPGGANWIQEVYFNSAFGLSGSGNMKVSSTAGNALAYSCNGNVIMTTSPTHATVNGLISHRSNSGSSNVPGVVRSAGTFTTATIANGAIIYATSGNITGTIAMYGVKNS